MKVGFSFGGCLRDIVEGKVDHNDVMVIITATRMTDLQSLHSVVDDYATSRLRGLDQAVCRAVAERLYREGKLHQPRLVGASTIPQTDDFLWMDLVPTRLTDDPGLQHAWENYRVLLTLLCDSLPDLGHAPHPYPTTLGTN
jgi:hypothetical protein